MTSDFIGGPPFVWPDTACGIPPHQQVVVARAEHDLLGGWPIAHADRSDILLRVAAGPVNTPLEDPEIVSDCSPTRDPDGPELIVSNGPLVAPGAATGWRVFRRRESFRIERWSKSSFRLVDPSRYGTAIQSVRFSESTHLRVFEKGPDESCIHAPRTISIDHPDACRTGFWRWIDTIRVVVGRNVPVLTARDASIDQRIALVSAINGVFFYCMTAHASICCAHVRANEDISGETAATGGPA
jgi:hypothetical protein